MKKWIFLCFAAILVATGTPGACGRALAQEAASPPAETKRVAAETRPQAVYRMDFVVRELEGDKRINTRSYTMSVQERDWGKFRVGSQIPIHVEGGGIQHQYVGIDIDCRPETRESGLFLGIRFESSSVPAQDSAASPIIRSVSYSGDALVAIGKPTVIAKLDDVMTNHRFEVEVTATKM
jgi:hypothetical protein